MIIQFHKMRRSFVFCQKDGIMIPVGVIFDSIINSEKGRIEAFWVKTKEGLRVLYKEDIKEWQGKKTVIIESEEKFFIPEEASRLQEVFEKEVGIINAQVWNRNTYIGKVYDFSFDIYSMFILQIYVSKGIFFWQKKRKIHRSKIVKINENGIFIAENNIRTIKDIEKNDLLSSVKAKKNI